MKLGMERLKFMQGEWNVQAYFLNDKDEWQYTEIPNETTISPMLTGVCHREEMPVAYGNERVRLFFSWSYDKYREVFRMISCDDAHAVMQVLEGNFKANTNTVVIDNLRMGTAVLDEYSGKQAFTQLASSKNDENSFTDVFSESYDNGKTWLPVFRAIHTRKST